MMMIVKILKMIDSYVTKNFENTCRKHYHY